MISIQKLYKSFGQVEVLKGVDLDLSEPGKITAVLGPNGSGQNHPAEMHPRDGNSRLRGN